MIVTITIAFILTSQFANASEQTSPMGSCKMTVTCDGAPSSPFSVSTVQPTGPQIPTGRPGKRGAKGDKGETGDIGSRGAKGDPATPCICPSQEAVSNKIANLEDNLRRIHAPQDCREVVSRREGSRGGVYTIYPPEGDGKGVDVYCDTETDGGGWIVFQRRMDGSEDFYRVWADYAKGFGNLEGEFWLGLDNIRLLMGEGEYELRIDLADFENNTRFAKYRKFVVGPKESNYPITTAQYSGDAGNAMTFNLVQFSTKDQDHDTHGRSCSEMFKGGWWYTACHSANLNGLYLRGKHTSYADGIEWAQWKGAYYSLRFTEMKMRKIL